MNLILCNSDDLAALWTWQQLGKERGGIELVTAEMLACALRWEHRVTTSGTSTTITLADRRVIRSDDVGGVLNRLDRVPVLAPNLSDADREYATSEIYALYASWLHALPGRVWNRATPAGLSGSTWRHPAEWMQLAARAGFDVGTASAGPWAAGPAEASPTLLVAGTQVLGNAPAHARPSALALSRLAGAPLLGIELTNGGTFRNATTRPDLRCGGASLIDVLRHDLFEEAA